MRTFVLREPTQLKMLTAFLEMNWAVAAQQSKPLSVTVSEYKRKRNTEQNKLLHALLTEIANSAWVNGKQYSAEVWKEHFKREYIGTEEIQLPDGSFVEQAISTTTLSVPEFADFVDRIQAYAASIGVEIGH